MVLCSRKLHASLWAKSMWSRWRREYVPIVVELQSNTHLTHTQVLSKYGTWMTLFYPNPTAVELSNSTYKNSTLIFYSQGILEKQGENLPWISRTPINSNPSPSSFSSILCTTTISINHWPTVGWTCTTWRRWKQGTMRQTRHTWTWREAWIGRFKMLITSWIIRGVLRKVIPRSLPTSLIKKGK